MLGNDDIEVLIDEPITAAELFGEDDEEAPALPPLSPDPNLDENAPPATDDATDAAQRKQKRKMNRLPNLNEKWITDASKEGMYAVNKYFENVKLKKGKGNELHNVNLIMRRYEYWAQQCYPKLCFKDFVDKVEGLSGKKLVKNALQEIRNNRSTGAGIVDEAVDDGDGGNGIPDQGNPFLNTSEPITSPSSQAFASFSSPQPITNSDSKVTDELREIIRRKREEAIAKRKRKLEESLNRSDMSTSQANEEHDQSIGGGEKNNDTSILDSSYMSVSDANGEMPPLNSTRDSVSQSEMEISDGEDLKEIIRKKREEAIAKRKRKLEDSRDASLCTVQSNGSEINTEISDNYSSQDNKEHEITSDNSQTSYMSVSESNARETSLRSQSSMSVSETSEGKTHSVELRGDSYMSVSEDNEDLRGSSIDENSKRNLETVSESSEETLRGSCVGEAANFEHESASQSDKDEGSNDTLENSLNYPNTSTSRTNEISEIEKGEDSSVPDDVSEEEPSDSIEKGKMEIEEQEVTNQT